MERLKIYQKALELIVQIYYLTNKNSQISRDYSLIDQLRRAAISIMANIAEGYKRSTKQFQNYLRIASGSANEVVALLQVVMQIYNIDTLKLQEKFRYLGIQINSFSESLTDG